MAQKLHRLSTISDDMFKETVVYGMPKVSSTQPTKKSEGTDLWEGYVWLKPDSTFGEAMGRQKIYLGGKFVDLGLSIGENTKEAFAGSRGKTLENTMQSLIPGWSPGGGGGSTPVQALGSLAYKSSVDWITEVTNKPVFPTYYSTDLFIIDAYQIEISEFEWHYEFDLPTLQPDSCGDIFLDPQITDEEAESFFSLGIRIFEQQQGKLILSAKQEKIDGIEIPLIVDFNNTVSSKLKFVGTDLYRTT